MPPKRSNQLKKKRNNSGSNSKSIENQDQNLEFLNQIAEENRANASSHNSNLPQSNEPAQTQITRHERRKQFEYLINNQKLKKALAKKQVDQISLNQLHNIDPNIQCPDTGFTLLMLAVKDDRADIIEKLLAHEGIDVNIKEKNGFTAFRIAVQNGKQRIAAMLLADERVDVDAKDKIGDTALICAASNANNIIVEMLLANKRVDVSAKNAAGFDPLIAAALRGYNRIVEKLLAFRNDKGERVVDPNTQKEDGFTALMMAAQNGHESTVELLLADDRIDVNTKEKGGFTALMAAAKNGHERIVAMFLADGRIDLDAKDEEGFTASMYAAQNGHERIVAKFLAHRHEANAKSEEVIIAAQNGHERIVNILLDHGSEANAKNEEGATALMLAAQNGHERIVRILLDHGSEANAKDKKYGVTALMLAAQNRHERIVGMVLAHEGIDVNIKDEKHGATALMFAATHGGKEVVEPLLPLSNIDAVDLFGQSALLLAIKYNQLEVAKILVEAGAAVVIADYAGNTAYKLAKEKGLEEAAELIKVKLIKLAKEFLEKKEIEYQENAINLLKAIKDAELEEYAESIKARLIAEGIITEGKEASESEASSDEEEDLSEGSVSTDEDQEGSTLTTVQDFMPGDEQAKLEEKEGSSVIAELPSITSIAGDDQLVVRAAEEAKTVQSGKPNLVNEGTSGINNAYTTPDTTPTTTPTFDTSFDFKAFHLEQQQQKAQKAQTSESKLDIYKFSWKIKGHSYSVKEGNIIKVGNIYLGISWKVEAQLGSVLYKKFEYSFKQGMVSSEHGESGIKAFLEYQESYELKVCKVDKRVLTSKKAYLNPFGEKLVLFEHVKNHKGVEDYLRTHGHKPMQEEKVLLTELPDNNEYLQEMPNQNGVELVGEDTMG